MNDIPQSYHGKPLIHAWGYKDANGETIGIVARYHDADGKKDIVPFFKRNGKTWTAGIELNSRPLYGLNMLVTHLKDKAVFVVEGEKSAAALQGMGITAVSSLGGSQAVSKADWAVLSGCKMVYLLPDNDEPGEHYARDVYAALMALELPPQVKVLRLSGLPDKGDIVDWIKSWGGYAWDEYEPIPEAIHPSLKEALKDELKNAEPVPEEWTAGILAVLAGSGCSVFDWEKPGEIETKTPPVQALQSELIPEPFRAWLADVSHRMQTPPRLCSSIEPCYCGFNHWRGMQYQA